MPDAGRADLDAAEGLLARGDAAAALRLAIPVLSGDADAAHPAWHRLCGLALAAGGRVRESLPHLRRYAALRPDEPAAWINLGNAAIDAGEGDEAARAFAQAGVAGADGIPYFLGRGLALLATGAHGDALPWLQRARRLEPDAVDVRLALGQCLAGLERFEALGDCIAGLDAATLALPQRTVFAWLLAMSGRDQAALALYRELLAAAPDAIDARVQAALLLERMNRVGEAAGLLEAAGRDAIAAGGAMARLAEARIARRQGQPAATADALHLSARREADPAMAAQLWFELAKARDQLGHADAAMQALAGAHDHAALAFRRRHPQVDAGGVLAWLGERLQRPLPPAEAHATSDPPDPVFLAGFPRSGTTLLEQMLAGHPALQVLDERPAMEDAIAAMHALPDWPRDDLDAGLARLDAAQRERLRVRYRTAVARHLAPDGRLVDKYPLYLTRVAHIQRLFPASDWLLLLRHPCDCVLSCHFQAFGLNGGALAFASLQATARTYAAVMDYWEAQRPLARPRVHVLRYEALVADPQAALAPLMAFLGLEPDARQLDVTQAVAARTRRINTPSYAQVAEPVHRQAIGRWRRYRAHFDAATLDLLAPFVDRYGYSLD